eukprot:212597_1
MSTLSVSALCVATLITYVAARNTLSICRGVHEPGKNAYGFGGGSYSAYQDINSSEIIIPSQTYAFDACNFDISRDPDYSWKYSCCANDEVCMEVFEGTQTCTSGTDITTYQYTFNHTQRTYNCDPTAAECALSYDWFHNCNQTGGCNLCYNYAHVNLVSGGCAKDYATWGGFNGIYISSKCTIGNTASYLHGWFTDDQCTTPTPGAEGGYNDVFPGVCGAGGNPAQKNFQCNFVETLFPTDNPSIGTPDPSVSPTKFPTSTPITGAPTASPVTSMPSVSPTEFPTLLPSVSPTLQPSGEPSLTPTAPPSQQPSVSPTTAAPTAAVCDGDEDCDDGYSCKWESLSCIWSNDGSCHGVCVADDEYCNEEDKGNKWGSWNHLLNDPDQCKLCYCVEKGARHCGKIYELAADKEQWQERVSETCPFAQYDELNDDGSQCAFDDLRVEEPVTECSCDVLRCAPDSLAGKAKHVQTTIAIGVCIVTVVSMYL